MPAATYRTTKNTSFNLRRENRIPPSVSSRPKMRKVYWNWIHKHWTCLWYSTCPHWTCLLWIQEECWAHVSWFQLGGSRNLQERYLPFGWDSLARPMAPSKTTPSQCCVSHSRKLPFLLIAVCITVDSSQRWVMSTEASPTEDGI